MLQHQNLTDEIEIIDCTQPSSRPIKPLHYKRERQGSILENPHFLKFQSTITFPVVIKPSPIVTKPEVYPIPPFPLTEEDLAFVNGIDDELFKDLEKEEKALKKEEKRERKKRKREEGRRETLVRMAEGVEVIDVDGAEDEAQQFDEHHKAPVLPSLSSASDSQSAIGPSTTSIRRMESATPINPQHEPGSSSEKLLINLQVSSKSSNIPNILPEKTKTHVNDAQLQSSVDDQDCNTIGQSEDIPVNDQDQLLVEVPSQVETESPEEDINLDSKEQSSSFLNIPESTVINMNAHQQPTQEKSELNDANNNLQNGRILEPITSLPFPDRLVAEFPDEVNLPFDNSMHAVSVLDPEIPLSSIDMLTPQSTPTKTQTNVKTNFSSENTETSLTSAETVTGQVFPTDSAELTLSTIQPISGSERTPDTADPPPENPVPIPITKSNNNIFIQPADSPFSNLGRGAPNSSKNHRKSPTPTLDKQTQLPTPSPTPSPTETPTASNSNTRSINGYTAWVVGRFY